MSSKSETPTETPDVSNDDPLEAVRENEDAFEKEAERDDRFGAMARYFLAVAKGEQPDDYDAELAGLPKIGGDE